MPLEQGERSNQGHHDIAHLHFLTNLLFKYQLPTPYGFRDTARTTFPAVHPPTSPPGCHG